ncbi:MAG: BMP family ABC transporter substrate-binding protein [Chloroflexi bacterium]|nr:BMP family ABC transporter substrate-binding protein [Chloroflexota bacterium]
MWTTPTQTASAPISSRVRPAVRRANCPTSWVSPSPPTRAAFLAGYAGAATTQTGKVATFGGINIPPVSIFMKGFEAGVKYYNAQKGTNVEVLGWSTEANDGSFTGNFESLDDGRSFAESFVQEGADIIMPVAGPVGLGSAAYCQETGSCKIVGVDTDWTVSASEYSDVILTSVMKNMNVAVFDTIKAVVDGTFAGGVYTGTLANGGVGLAAVSGASDGSRLNSKPFSRASLTAPSPFNSLPEIKAGGGFSSGFFHLICIRPRRCFHPDDDLRAPSCDQSRCEKTFRV